MPSVPRVIILELSCSFDAFLQVKYVFHREGMGGSFFPEVNNVF